MKGISLPCCICFCIFQAFLGTEWSDYERGLSFKQTAPQMCMEYVMEGGLCSEYVCYIWTCGIIGWSGTRSNQVGLCIVANAFFDKSCPNGALTVGFMITMNEAWQEMSTPSCHCVAFVLGLLVLIIFSLFLFLYIFSCFVF